MIRKDHVTDLEATLDLCFRDALHGYRHRMPSTISSLPADKNAHPRLLCLDMKDWIQLARESPNALSLARTAISEACLAGTLVVAITEINQLEVWLRADAESRARVVDTMLAISNNFFTRRVSRVLAMEIDAALDQDCDDLMTRVRPHVVVTGIVAANDLELPFLDTFGALHELIHSAASDPRVSRWMLANSTTDEARRALLEQEQHAESALRDARDSDRKFGEDENRVGFLGRVLGDVATTLAATPATRASGIALRRLAARDEESARHALAKCPAMDVFAELELRRARNASMPVKSNDNRDLSFLRFAVPYANIVVTEGMWVNVARQAGLGDRYGTALLSKLEQLPQELTKQGCL